MREYMRAYRARLLDEARQMLGGKCVRCGATDDLHFDHIDRTTKSFTLGGARNASRSQIMAEAAKCQLLCQKHHLEKSYEAGDLNKAEHGHSLYRRGCRCDACRAGATARMRKYRASKRIPA